MENPRYWRLKKQRYSLLGEVCPHCDSKIFPPRDICPECGSEAKTDFAFSGKGKVYSYTVMRDAPAGYEQHAPYTVAIVALDEGPMVTAQLTDLGADWHACGNGHAQASRRRREKGDFGVRL